MTQRRLRGWPLAVIVVGAIWFLQGIGLLPGSFMSGDPTWAYIGGAMVLVGAALLRPRARQS